MSKRKARDEGNQPTRTPRPVLYYPADDNAGPTQCVMPTSPIPTPRTSPVRGRSNPKDTRKSSPVKYTSFSRKGRSALDNYGYVPENIPTPRTRPKTSLFTSVTRASGSSSTSRQVRRTFAAAATSPIRSPAKRATTVSSDIDDNPDGVQSEYDVDSSDGDVPTRLRTSRRSSKQTSSGASQQESPRSNQKSSPRMNPQSSSKASHNTSPTRPPTILDWVGRTPTTSTPFKARIVPVQPLRRKRPSEPSIYSELRSPRISRAKRPRMSNPLPAPDPEIIVVSSSEDEAEARRSPSGSPSLGGHWPSREASPACSTPTPSSRSSDVVLLDSPPAPDVEIQEIPGRNRGSTEDDEGGRLKRRGRRRSRRIESSPVQEQERGSGSPQRTEVGAEASAQQTEAAGPSRGLDERNPFLLFGEKGRYRSVSTAIASGSGLSRDSPFAPHRLLNASRPLFRPSTTASGLSSLNGTPRSSVAPAREDTGSATPMVMRMSLPLRSVSPARRVIIQLDPESEPETDLAPGRPIIPPDEPVLSFGRPVLLLEGPDVPESPPETNILPKNVPVTVSDEPNPQPDDPRAPSLAPDASREPILVPTEPITLLDDPTPPPPNPAPPLDEYITLPEEPNPSNVSPRGASIQVSIEPTHRVEPMASSTSPLTPVPALQELVPTSTQPSSSSRPKPRVLRFDCVLLPRASKATRKALSRPAQNAGYPKGKGKSVAALMDAGLVPRVESEEPTRKVDKGKGVARGEKRRRGDSSPSLGEEDTRRSRTEDTDEYQDSEGEGVQVMSDEEYEVDDDSPGPSSPKRRGRKPAQTVDTAPSPEPGPSNHEQVVKYLVIDPHAALPKTYKNLPEEVRRTPGRYCHCCRTRGAAGKLKMLCTGTNTRRQRGRKRGSRHECGTAWCQRCIAKHDIVFNPIQPDFTCPMCSNSCECDVCRRERGQPALGRGAFKVVKQKPGRRPLEHVVAANDDAQSDPPAPESEEPQITNPEPSTSEPARPPVPAERGLTTWHGRHTPPPLRARRSGGRAFSTGNHIFVPRHPRERESREASVEDPDVDVEGTDSNSGAHFEGISGLDEEAERLDEDEDGSSDWEDKMRTFEGDYSGAADTTVLGADSVSFDIHPEIDHTEPQAEDEGNEMPDFHFVYESNRTSIDPEAEPYDDDVQVDDTGEEDPELESEVRALGEQILSLGQASPTRIQANDAILGELDAAMENAQRIFNGPEVIPDRQSAPDPGPTINIPDVSETNAIDVDAYLANFDFGELHPEGTFEVVPGITMAGLRPMSHDSARDISLFGAATGHEQTQMPSVSPLYFAQPASVFEFSPQDVLTTGSPALAPESPHAAQYEPQPSPASLPASDALSALQLDIDIGWPPELEFDLPFFLDHDPELTTATDPMSAKSTELGTPSPQLGNYGDSVTVVAGNLFDPNPTSRGSPRVESNAINDLDAGEDASYYPAPGNESQTPSETPTHPTEFVLPTQEQQQKVRKVLRSKFRAKAPVPTTRIETRESTMEKGKFLRSRRRYGAYPS